MSLVPLFCKSRICFVLPAITDPMDPCSGSFYFGNRAASCLLDRGLLRSPGLRSGSVTRLLVFSGQTSSPLGAVVASKGQAIMGPCGKAALIKPGVCKGTTTEPSCPGSLLLCKVLTILRSLNWLGRGPLGLESPSTYSRLLVNWLPGGHVDPQLARFLGGLPEVGR